MVVRSPQDVIAGFVFMAAAAAFVVFGRELPVGTPGRMGPGFFPVMLASVLAGIGILTVLKGLRGSGEGVGPIPWRPLLLLTGGIVFFAASLERLGLGPALFGALVAAAASDRDLAWRQAAMAIGAIVAFCYLVFVRALGLPLPFLGPWLTP